MPNSDRSQNVHVDLFSVTHMWQVGSLLEEHEYQHKLIYRLLYRKQIIKAQNGRNCLVDVTPCNLIDEHTLFGGTCCLHRQDRRAVQ